MNRVLVSLMVWTMLAPPMMTVAQAQSGGDPYTIMKPEPGTKPQPRPEPWLPPKYQSPRGTKQHVTAPRPRRSIPPPRLQTPPPIFVPETGRLLPNLPAGRGAGPGGAETGQDRAVRCAHQAGVYGQAAGDRGVYLGACINQ